MMPNPYSPQKSSFLSSYLFFFAQMSTGMFTIHQGIQAQHLGHIKENKMAPEKAYQEWWQWAGPEFRFQTTQRFPQADSSENPNQGTFQFV